MLSRRTASSFAFLSGLCIAVWASAEESELADLIDVARIQSLTLDDLGWQEESREEIGDVLVLVGSWRGPEYFGFTKSLEETRKTLSEFCQVWIPLAQPAGQAISQIVWGIHRRQVGYNTSWDACLDLPSRLPVAILRHGQESQDWTDLGFASRDDWIFSWQLDFLRAVNPCEPNDYRHSCFPLALAETQLMSLTLLSRLLEAQGYEAGPAAMGGLSKEGLSTWLAAAVDERLVAAAPGGFPLEDMVEGLSRFVENGGCAYPQNALDTLKWLQTTPAGATALKYFSVPEFAADLKPEFLLVFGDVGLFGMHDGTYFATGAETEFLENFSAVPYRYDRVPDRSGEPNQDPTAVRETLGAFRTRQVTQLAHFLLTGDTTTHPKIVDSWVDVDETDSGSFRAGARVDPEAEAVRLWWSYSDNRTFREQGNAPWVSVEMTRAGDAWLSPTVTTPSGTMVGWYVEAENTLEWEGSSLSQRDTSPQRFFNEFEPLSCEIPQPDCPPPIAAPVFRRGDSNGDGDIDIADVSHTLNWLFAGGADPGCVAALNTNGDDKVDLTDAVALLNFLFAGGTAPAAPHPECGPMPPDEVLGCETPPESCVAVP